MTSSSALPVKGISSWRSIGIWMAALLALAQAASAVRAFADPAGFATYLGLPLIEPRDIGMVYVYGLRTAFVAIFVPALIFRGEIETLRLLALAALAMPIGDAFLTYNAGAPAATVLRHTSYVLFVLLTAFMLHRSIPRSA